MATRAIVAVGAERAAEKVAVWSAQWAVKRAAERAAALAAALVDAAAAVQERAMRLPTVPPRTARETGWPALASADRVLTLSAEEVRIAPERWRRPHRAESKEEATE